MQPFVHESLNDELVAVLLLHCMLHVGFRAMHESMTSHKIKTWGPGAKPHPAGYGPVMMSQRLWLAGT